MSTPHRKPAFERACRFLQERPRQSPRASLRTLARQCDVSYVTMWKAAHAVKAGTGPHTFENVERTQQPAPRWRQVLSALCEDLRQGVYPPDRNLPGGAVLLDRYGVSYPTLRRALTAATEEGLLVRYKRTYRVRRLSAATPIGTVAIIAREAPQGEAHSSSYLAHMRSAEQACTRALVRPRILMCDLALGGGYKLSAEDNAFLERLHDSPHVLGVLFLMRGIDPRNGLRLIERLVRQHTPVAVFDEGRGLVLPPHLKKNPLVALHSHSLSEQPGQTVGRHLASLGHLRVAYIAPPSAPLWSRRRLAGLRRALEVQVPRARVLTSVSVVPELNATSLELNAEAQRLLGIADHCGDGTLARSLRRTVHRVREASRDVAGALSLSALSQGTQGSGVYERLLQDPSITAWVGASDRFALDALRFLYARHVPVPDRVSVVGFDDSEEAFVERLTSYNFNTPAVMHAMVHHVLMGSERRRSPRWTAATADIEGYLSQRGSTGAARTRRLPELPATEPAD